MLKLSFHGGVKEVTGSCHLLQIGDASLLIDCGMHQGERMCGKANFEPFDFDIAKIKAVLVTHAHFDHCGRLPLLIKRGYKGPIYCTTPTKPLVELVLRDGLHVMQENAKLCHDDVLYEEEDVTATMKQVKTMNYHTDFFPIPEVACTFFDAGHILGSAFVKVSAEDKTIIFSGDIGNDDAPILPNTEHLPPANVVVCEATYGDRDHDAPETRNRYLGDALNTVLKRGGTAIIPAFSLERTQELLYAMDQLIEANKVPRVPVYLDSPLAIKATDVYREYVQYLQFDESILRSSDRDFFSFPGLKVCLSPDDSKMINADHGAKIIIAGSGMMSGGRVMHHLKRYLPHEDSGVLVIGYQAEGTMGRQIQDGAKFVTIHEEQIPVRAQLFEIESFSAHGDRTKLSTWLKSGGKKVDRVFLVHGDSGAKEMFEKQLEGELVAGEIIIPDLGQVFEIK